MPYSQAYRQFEDGLAMAQELLKLEKRLYHNPPRTDEQSVVRGLRGATAILVIASFEGFLRQAIEEHLSELTSHRHIISLTRLPDKLRVNNVYFCLDRAMKGPLYQEPLPRVQRLDDIDRACKVIISGDIAPKVFCDTSGNPNSKNLRVLFSNIALEDITNRIKSKFDKKWGKPTSKTFIDDKLNEVVNRRHVVAHTADALNISRNDLRESIRFVHMLAQLLDAELSSHISHLIKTCTV
jgi:hypothetical protein